MPKQLCSGIFDERLCIVYKAYEAFGLVFAAIRFAMGERKQWSNVCRHKYYLDRENGFILGSKVKEY